MSMVSRVMRKTKRMSLVNSGNNYPLNRNKVKHHPKSEVVFNYRDKEHSTRTVLGRKVFG